MKIHYQSSFVILLTGTLLLAGCSKAEETKQPQEKSTEASVNPQPATTPPENAPTVAPAPVPAPAPPKKEQAKAPAAPARVRAPAPKVVQQAPSEPDAEAPPIARTAPAAPAPLIQRVALPVGTLIPIRMIDSVDSKTDQAGQTFRASIDSDISIENQIVVPKGADARLTLRSVSSAGNIRGKSELQLELDRIVIGKTSYTVSSNVVERTAKAEGSKTAKEVGIGAAIGAAVGAIAGGKKGAAIGAGVGAGSGAAVAVITKGEQVLVPSETRLEFRLEQAVEIQVMPRTD